VITKQFWNKKCNSAFHDEKERERKLQPISFLITNLIILLTFFVIQSQALLRDRHIYSETALGCSLQIALNFIMQENSFRHNLQDQINPAFQSIKS
jgi:hypothetical protein